jgi:hypothetical protein
MATDILFYEITFSIILIAISLKISITLLKIHQKKTGHSCSTPSGLLCNLITILAVNFIQGYSGSTLSGLAV